MHLYQKEFGDKFELGFNLTDYSFLTDRSWHNDVSPSFYFKKGNHFYVLWVERPNVDDRENDSDARYTIMLAENEGDENAPELTSTEVVFETEHAIDLKPFFDAKEH
ncbi:hypothetical protein [uncultured Shewanella sp.]|uniref:hypothetical protein n=1 Tax=uncultured Shewanella sp. TaxID=173975 RepID=UPI0026235F75|nr:hypothetical protein [uncultured Shewanella sp.]